MCDTGTYVHQTQQVNLFHHACSGLNLTINKAIDWDSAGHSTLQQRATNWSLTNNNTDFGAALNNPSPLGTTKHCRMLRSHFVFF